MTPREFRQEQEFNYDHFTELTKTGINPNYVNIELFAHEYHKAKVKNLGLADVMRCSHCGEEIKQGEQDYMHKIGFGCCIQEETEKDETYYELFGSTDCDPE